MAIYKIDSKESKIMWTGRKLTSSHSGTIDVKSGQLDIDDHHIKSGSFELDMTTIDNTDIEDAGMKDKLLTHLRSPDFFNVQAFNTGQLELVSAEKQDAGYHVKAKLTLKGHTEEIEFDANISIEGDEATATATFDIDRTLWDIRFGSGKFFASLGDKVIKDKIGIELKLKAKKE